MKRKICTIVTIMFIIFLCTATYAGTKTKTKKNIIQEEAVEALGMTTVLQ